MRLQKRLTPFADPLPAPGNLQPVSRNGQFTFYIVRMLERLQKLHRDLPPTRIWGSEGKYPGPTIEVKRNEPVRVLWLNQLPKRHILAVDKTIHGASRTPEVRTHAHGVVSPPDSDGHPDAWFTRGFRQTGSFFQRKISRYPNTQRAATL